jgi:mannose-6-phosphate isomerase-like protein (cupin superfamily)
MQTRPYLLHDDGKRLQTLGALVSLLASAQQTSGAFNLFDAILPTDFSTPLHIHYAEDVAVFVLEGVLTFFWGDEKMEARAGSYFFQPRGVPHGFRVTGSNPARILYMTLPAGFDEFVIERSKSINNFESMVSEAHFKIEILGSLPE